MASEEKLVTSNPRIALVFYPYKNHYTGITQSNLLDVHTIEATSSVKTASYSKSKTDASGQFSIDLTSDREWTRMVRPGDWMTLYMSRFKIDIKGTKGMKCVNFFFRHLP